jgi:hypothetical protein
MYDPLHFVLLYPHGEPGWCPDLRHSDAAVAVDAGGHSDGEAGGNDGNVNKRNRLTPREWAAYFMQVRMLYYQ